MAQPLFYLVVACVFGAGSASAKGPTTSCRDDKGNAIPCNGVDTKAIIAGVVCGVLLLALCALGCFVRARRKAKGADPASELPTHNPVEQSYQKRVPFHTAMLVVGETPPMYLPTPSAIPSYASKTGDSTEMHEKPSTTLPSTPERDAGATITMPTPQYHSEATISAPSKYAPPTGPPPV